MKHRQLARNATPPAAGLLQAAVERTRTGRFDEAEQLFKSLIAAQPQHFDALRQYGLLLLQQGRAPEALETLAAAVRAAPKHAAAWSELGVAHACLGRLPQAAACYDEALALDPRNAEALANKGNALIGLQRPLEALASYDAALALHPRFAAVLSNRGGLLYELGRPAEALASLDRALAIAPGNADALNNRGNALVALDRAQEALASYDKALALDPRCANAHNNRGNALLKLRRAGEALASYDRALELKGPSVETLTNRGDALKALQRHPEAIASFVKALAMAPNSADVLTGLAGALLEANRPADALACCDKALACRPDSVEALANRATALVALKRPLEAVASCDLALARAPNHVEALNNRGAALTGLGREIEALADFDAAIAGRPDHALVHDNKGVALLQLGRFEEAAAAFNAAVALAPARTRAYHHLTLARRIEAGDPCLAALETLVRDEAPTPQEDRVYAHFALGKALADHGEHERAFQHFAAGNAAKRRLTGYDEAAALGFLDRTRLAYANGFIGRVRGDGSACPAPVFVIGMPRSGTTLVEQILASHPEAYGAGEINDLEIAALANGPETASALQAPEAVWRMAGADFRRVGEAYIERIRGRAPTARRIVNKTTENFRYAGLIALALPNARIVHVRRDPLDACFSCFANLFIDNVPYASDLGELGRYYRGYVALMAHWRRTLPRGMMIDVRYEDVVADLEGQGRRIVSHCGLAWDPRCLDFHANERSVRTASVAQVRRPIYPSAVGRWRRYEAFLGPLIEALGLPPGAPALREERAA